MANRKNNEIEEMGIENKNCYEIETTGGT